MTPCSQSRRWSGVNMSCPHFALIRRVTAVRDLGKRGGAALIRPGGRPGNQGSGQGSGLVLGAVSALLFSASGTFGAALLKAGWSPAGAVLARVLVAAAVLAPVALTSLRGRWRVVRHSWRQMLIYGLVGVAAVQVAYFNAVARMPVGVAILLTYLAIVFIVAWLWVRHGHRPTLLTMAGAVAALGGLVLMLDLWGGSAPGIGWAGLLWGLATAVASTVYFVQSAASSPSGPGESPAAPGAGDGRPAAGRADLGRNDHRCGGARRGERSRPAATTGVRSGRAAFRWPGVPGGAVAGAWRARHGHPLRGRDRIDPAAGSQGSRRSSRWRKCRSRWEPPGRCSVRCRRGPSSSAACSSWRAWSSSASTRRDPGDH